MGVAKGKETAILVAVAIFAFAIGYWSHVVQTRGVVNGCGDKAYLEIFRLEPNGMKPDTSIYVAVPASLDVEGKLRVLAQRLSYVAYRQLPIELMGFDLRNGQRIARINLRELSDTTMTPSWRGQYFQGSTGGEMTAHTLTRTLLQPTYSGDWVDGVEFFYEGEPFGRDWDHIYIGGTHLRSAYAK